MENNCRLCNINTNLDESHIIPSFVFKWLKDSSGTGYLRFSDQPNRRVQDGKKYFWLCRECEERLNLWETRFANVIFHPFNKGQTDTAAYGAWFLKFCVSISWRVLNYYMAESDINHFSDNLKLAAKDAYDIWKEFLLDKRPHPERFEQHFFSMDAIANYTNQEMPTNINRYILRSVDIDVVCGGKNGEDGFTYSKLGRFVILGFINMYKPREWVGSKVHVKHGEIKPHDYTVPVQFGEYFMSRARKVAAYQASISEQQDQKIEQSFWRTINKVANSESFKAMDHDVKLFGKDAFKKKSE